MDTKIQPPAVSGQQSESPTTAEPPLTTTATSPQTNKSEQGISDKTAAALLTINGLESSTHGRSRGAPSFGLIISVVLLVLVVILASFALSAYKPGSSTTGSSSGSDTNATKGAANQVNQDLNTCADPVRAAAEC